MTTVTVIAASSALLALLLHHPRVRHALRLGAVLSTLGHKTDIAVATGGSVGGAVAASGQILSSGVRELLGFSFSEAVGAAAEFRLHDGFSASAPLLTGGVTFQANGSTEAWYADEGVEVTSGAIFLERVSGSIRGVVYWG